MFHIYIYKCEISKKFISFIMRYDTSKIKKLCINILKQLIYGLSFKDFYFRSGNYFVRSLVIGNDSVRPASEV